MEVQLKNSIKHKQKSLFNVRRKKTNERKIFLFNIFISDAPKVSTSDPIIAADSSTIDIKFRCDIDSNPESIVHWRFNKQTLFKSDKYNIIHNKSSSYLILQQIQSTHDYGFYSCNATNKLGYNFTTIQLRSKGNRI